MQHPETPQQSHEYQPHFGSVHDIESHLEGLRDEEVIAELAHLRYDLGQETIRLLQDARQEHDERLEQLIKLIALSDVPNAEGLVGDQREELARVLSVISRYKKPTHH